MGVEDGLDIFLIILAAKTENHASIVLSEDEFL
jgi:hypothetical protein